MSGANLALAPAPAPRRRRPMICTTSRTRSLGSYRDAAGDQEEEDDDDTFFIPRSKRGLQLSLYRRRRTPASPPMDGRGHEGVTWDDINLVDRSGVLEPGEFNLRRDVEDELVRLHKAKAARVMQRRPVNKAVLTTDQADAPTEVVVVSGGDGGGGGGNGRPGRTGSIVDDLLGSIYEQCDLHRYSVDSDTFTEYSTTSECHRKSDDLRYTKGTLYTKEPDDLNCIAGVLKQRLSQVGQVLMRQLKRRDRLILKRDKNFDVITAAIQAVSQKRRVDTRMKFSIEPLSGDSGFNQWLDAMKMVARLSEGVPHEFRKTLWLTLADRHIQHCKIDWARTRSFCFNERSNPDDDNLGVQIVKDLHRTGCSLFCGEDAEHNQALLKRVLLAYARWNKTVGYCQGFNMLAALILEVMGKKEDEALKVMILLIEGVLPESYFADNLRGLSVDMAVFRDLLKLRLPFLSRHLEKLQIEARDGATGTSYEPPLTNVFTMQWFLTLFSNCLPKSIVLRVWDLIFLEGSEVLLRTGLAIWDGLADRIMTVESADEFYSIMGVLTREMLEFGLMDANHLVKTIVQMAPFPFPQLSELRDKYTYNITPFTSAVGAVRRGLRMFYSDDEYDDEDDDQQIAVATWCLADAFPPPRSPDRPRPGGGGLGAYTDSLGRSPSPSSANFNSIGPGAFGPGSLANLPSPSKHNIDMERMTLDISALKKQYIKLRERQKQARIILTAGARQLPSKIERPPIAVNHLLLGKKALSSKNKKIVNPVVNIKVSNSSRRPPLRRQMSMDPKMFRKTSSNANAAKTIFWKDVGRNKESRIPPIDIKISSEAEQFAEINARRRSLEKEEESKNKPEKVNREDDDSSSTSTELCDDPDVDLSDLSFDEEVKCPTPVRQRPEEVVRPADHDKTTGITSKTIAENVNKSAPSTPCERTVSFFDSNEKLNGDTSGNEHDQAPKNGQDDCANNCEGAESCQDLEVSEIDELREAVKQLKMTPRKSPKMPSSSEYRISVEEQADDEVLQVEVDPYRRFSTSIISCQPDSQTGSQSPMQLSSASLNSGSLSNSIPSSPPYYCRNRSFSTESSPASVGSSKKVDPRNRTMSNPTSPIYAPVNLLPTSFSNVCVSINGRNDAAKRTINNGLSSSNDFHNSSYSPSKPIFNPFPTSRLRTKDLNIVGVKFGMYSSKLNQSGKNDNSLKFKL